MAKKMMYPKTKRYDDRLNVLLTEKLDGSNLTFFKYRGKLYVAQRNYVESLEELDKGKLYKGLEGWLDKYGKDLEEKLHPNASITGEWMGMGHLKYPNRDKQFYMFAKGNVNDEMGLYRLRYSPEHFVYPFTDQQVPEYVGLVPLVATLERLPSVKDLDDLYDEYVASVGRDVEGFVVNYNDNISKYVRMKNGSLADHFNWKNN